MGIFNRLSNYNSILANNCLYKYFFFFKNSLGLHGVHTSKEYFRGKRVGRLGPQVSKADQLAPL